MAQLLPELPDAILCGNDQIARGAADARRIAGLHVSLIGFDNWAVIAEPGRRMLAMIASQTFHGLERLPCKLVLRAGAP